jgi:hypothetical protein
VVPLKLLMKIFGFSKDFANMVALPMVALFLGTGNYTDEVPAIMLERLCTSPTYGMWYPPDKTSIASNLPPMVVFPNLSEFYAKWKGNLEKRVDVRLSTEVTRVVSRRHGVKVELASTDESQAKPEVFSEEYDEIVLYVQYVFRFFPDTY